MRLIRRIPSAEHSISPADHIIDGVFGERTFGYKFGRKLLLHRLKLDRPAPATLTLLDRENHQVWTARVPVVPSVPPIPDRVFNDDDLLMDDQGLPALSPDGHVLALAQYQSQRGSMRVWNWRDGDLIGDVQIPYAIKTNESHLRIMPDWNFNLQAQNDGRIWVTSALPFEGNR